MFEAKDGKKFGNAFRQKKYDSVHAGAEKKEPTAAEPTEEKQEEKGQHPVVQAHGKAHKVEITHDHEAGKHHVHSRHEDGHDNLSEHGSAQEAHEEGGKLAGVDAKEENPDEAQQGALSEEDGFQMPDLA